MSAAFRLEPDVGNRGGCVDQLGGPYWTRWRSRRPRPSLWECSAAATAMVMVLRAWTRSRAGGDREPLKIRRVARGASRTAYGANEGLRCTRVPLSHYRLRCVTRQAQSVGVERGMGSET